MFEEVCVFFFKQVYQKDLACAINNEWYAKDNLFKKLILLHTLHTLRLISV